MRWESATELHKELVADYLPAADETALPAGVHGVAGGDRRSPLRNTVLAPGFAIGIGIIDQGGRRSYGIGITVQSTRDLASPVIDEIASRSHGEFEVVVGGRVRPATGWHLTQCNPLRIGCSVGHPDVSAGTLGCFVRSKAGGRAGFLSNNHVLASSNRAKVGDPIFQPGRFDGGQQADTVATLAGFAPITFANTTNGFDAAWARHLARQPDFDPVTLLDTGGRRHGTIPDGAVSELLPGMHVVKVGRSSGLTFGRVRQVNVCNLNVPYGNKYARFDGQFQFESRSAAPFALPGDSGSVIVDDDCRVAGLLFAVTSSGGTFGTGLAYASPMEPILTALDLEIVSG
ncbi:S1 family peptidase [Prosthecodimorpha staleyi]|uniref:S1 family peptidase n=1 Tax=Prosthecodimorpha staleyi TaxID=2840188 RepID=A0A947D5I9_9HYPH|nr:S1 family peptidase [Prosthecodimorpha staleyi]MBT9291435.1 S1 family peptidase [Prosthecodimorpha staleyi]